MDFWKEIFSKLETICPIPNSEKEKAMSMMEVKNYPKGDRFGNYDEHNDDFAIIVKGLIKEFYLKPNGQEYIKGFRREGQTTGHYRSIILKEKSRMTIECMEDSIFLEAKYEQYQKMLEGHICWYRITKALDDIEFFIKEDREYQFLMFTAAERYHKFTENFPDLVGRVPQYQIALYIGVDPSSLNRILAKSK